MNRVVTSRVVGALVTKDNVAGVTVLPLKVVASRAETAHRKGRHKVVNRGSINRAPLANRVNNVSRVNRATSANRVSNANHGNNGNCVIPASSVIR